MFRVILTRLEDMIIVAMVVVILLFWTAGFSFAAEPTKAQRDRDAAAVLALEMELAKPKPVAKLLTFSEAMLTATAAGKPIVAYPVRGVGVRPDVPGQ